MRLKSPSTSGPVRRPWRAGLILVIAAIGLAACATARPSRPGLSTASDDRFGPPSGTEGLHGTDKPYQVNGRWYYPHAQPDYDQVGFSSWYGQQFHNHHTADGEIFDQFAPSAAHKTLPLPCLVEVTNLDNGRRLTLRVNDRGPFVGERILDVSRAAAETLGFQERGLAHVRVRYIGPAPALAPFTQAQAEPQRRARQFSPPVEQGALTPPAPDQDEDSQAVVRRASVRAVEPPADADPSLSPVIPPAPIAPISSIALATNAAPLDARPAGFSVQAGAFADRDNAQRVADRLAQAGDAQVSPITNRQGQTLYRVVLAGFRDVQAAEIARAQVAAAGFGDARIIGPF